MYEWCGGGGSGGAKYCEYENEDEAQLDVRGLRLKEYGVTKLLLLLICKKK